MNDIALKSPEPAASEGLRVDFMNELQLPAVIHPQAGERGAGAVAALLATSAVRNLLARHGAVLFRGFGLEGARDFTAIVNSHYGENASAYLGGVSSRVPVQEGRVYESTRIPAHLRIHQHNELAYLRKAPRDLLFFCEKPSPKGGETPLTDCRRLMTEIPQEVREVFKTKGLRNREHFYGRWWWLWTLGYQKLFVRLHRSWKAVFNTKDQETVRRHCEAMGVDLEWLWDGSARLTCNRSPTAPHPVTGEEVWFNQAATLNVTPYVYGWPKYLGYHLAYPYPRFRPFDVSFCDKTRIPHRYLEAIQKATDRVTVTFPWEKGDLLWADNFLVAHGRMPYKGSRRILVAIGPMVSSV